MARGEDPTHRNAVPIPTIEAGQFSPLSRIQTEAGCYNLAFMDKYSITCPCCEATITVDAQTGAILAHEEKKKVLGSFEDLKGELDKQKELREQIFAQEMSSMKDRERLLEEKFREALKRADTESDKPFKNPLDLE